MAILCTKSAGLENEEGISRVVSISGSSSANNGSALTRFAWQVLGIIYQPDFLVAKYIESGELVNMLPPPIKGMNCALYAYLIHKESLMPKKTRLLLDFWQERLANTVILLMC